MSTKAYRDEMKRQLDDIGGDLRKTRVRKPHRENCNCPAHAKKPRPCPYCPDDAQPHPNVMALGKHIQTYHKYSRKRTRHVLAPDGLGFVRRVAVDMSLATKMNLGAFTRFQNMLLATTPRRRAKRFSRADRGILKEIETLAESDLYRLRGADVPSNVAHVVYKIAVLAGVAPHTVEAALICYGIELLSRELRDAQQAPTVKVPARKMSAAVPDEVPRTSYFPSSGV